MYLQHVLDGLIYHPLNQKYTTNAKDNKFVEYKWKPPTKNSVDLYITFEKDPKSGKILNVYDNSVDENVRNKPYRIVNLFVITCFVLPTSFDICDSISVKIDAYTL